MNEREEPFEVYLESKIKIIKKIYKFTKMKKAESYRFILPKEVVGNLGVNDDTYYLVAYSPKMNSIIFLFFNFGAIALPDKGINDGFIHKIKMEGYLLMGMRKVWRSKIKEWGVQYGITIPSRVVKIMGINEYTLFIMGYVVEKKLLYIELRSMFEEIVMEKVPQEEREVKISG